MDYIGTANIDFLVGLPDLQNDRMYGFGSGDVLLGLGGDDLLFGGSGSDSMYGGNGSDVIFDNDDEDLFGKNETDFLNGDAGDDYLYGGDGVDYFDGGNDNDFLEDIGNTSDFLYGGNGDDTINAGKGADWLLGEAGDDTLNGEAGNDLLWGGADKDTFYYFFAAPVNISSLGTDMIYDFSAAADRMEFDPKDFDLSDPSQIGFANNDITAAIAAERIVYSRGSGTVWFNVNGTAAGYGSLDGFVGGAIAVLSGAPSLNETNFRITS
jgi:Ca2+-binding RTX toxin-like protein